MSFDAVESSTLRRIPIVFETIWNLMEKNIWVPVALFKDSEFGCRVTHIDVKLSSRRIRFIMVVCTDYLVLKRKQIKTFLPKNGRSGSRRERVNW